MSGITDYGLQALGRFKETNTYWDDICYGAEAYVLFKDDLAVKCRNEDFEQPGTETGLPDLRRECRMAKFLHKNNVSVPEPHGVFTYEHPLDDSVKIHGFTMQRINGLDPFDYQQLPEYRRIANLELEEYEKVRQLGIRAVDIDPNKLWDPEQNKLFLIDFTHWYRPREKELLKHFI